MTIGNQSHNLITEGFKMSSMIIRDEHVILRREYFGGMAFHKKLGTTIELDKEAQYLLEILGKPHEIRNLSYEMSKTFHKEVPKREIEAIIKNLENMGFVTKNVNGVVPEDHSITQFDTKEIDINKISSLNAPETVHLTITKKCNLSCPLCYEINKNVTEMKKNEIFTLIDKLAKMKVFQLAIGGGEPFLREDIYEIIEYCHIKGIVPNITTNGTLINDNIVGNIKNKVGGVTVSLNGYSSRTNIGRDKRFFHDIIHGIKLLLDGGIPAGVNFLVTGKSLNYINETFSFLKKLGVKWINVIRPKSGLINKHLNQYLLSRGDLKSLKKVLGCWSHLIRINVDTAFTCLMYDVPVKRLKEKAVYGCVSGVRFCTIDCNGNVYPCSFFKDEKYKAGNVLKDDFQYLWLYSDVFKKFREMGIKLKGRCGDCIIKNYCGGCRSIALSTSDDFYEEDVTCINYAGG